MKVDDVHDMEDLQLDPNFFKTFTHIHNTRSHIQGQLPQFNIPNIQFGNIN
jgi:hypothetical protein